MHMCSVCLRIQHTNVKEKEKTKVVIQAVACPLDGSDAGTAYLAVVVTTAHDLCPFFNGVSY